MHSPYAHAIIKSIDFTEAAKVPGVKGFLTGADFPEGHNLGNPEAFKELADKEPLCRKKVRMVGDEVAAVCATTEEAATEAAALVKDGMTLMVGGFMANGTPEPIIDELVKSNVKDLTVICNDAGFGRKKDKVTGEWKGAARGVGKLVENGQVKKLIASHVGLNPEFGAKYFEGEIDLELVPQGTLAERIRCGGSGLGGFYTPTGVGTEVAEGKEIKEIDGIEYILELPLHADVALIGGHTADAAGNLRYIGSERNFNPMMAMAADTVIAGVSEIVDAGQIGADYVETPGIFVDYLVGGAE